jgi:UDP-N-acetyl-D-glucosamine dehydrogenase
LVAPILEEGSGLSAGRDFHLGYSPERIDPGNDTWQLHNTPKVVSGIDGPSLEAVEAFYGRLVESTVAVSGTREAELSKLLENTFRHVNIALVNELAMYAADLNINIWEAIDAASSKPFGYLRFTPGPGVGGHCLPVDPSYLSWKVRRSLGMPFRFVELANDINDHMPDYVVRRLMLAFNRTGRAMRGANVLLLGLAYKRNTGDAREAPGTVIAQLLAALGAEVRIADPHLHDGTTAFEVVEATPEVLSSMDAVVIVTDHDAFDYAQVQRLAPFVLDTRNRISGPNVEQL